jgi:hypothetical protein
MQRVEPRDGARGQAFASALILARLAHPAAEHERMGEDALQFSVAPDLAHDVARDPAEIGSDRLQRPVGALELFGHRIANAIRPGSLRA